MWDTKFLHSDPPMPRANRSKLHGNNSKMWTLRIFLQILLFGESNKVNDIPSSMGVMPPHLTLAILESWFLKNTTFTPLTLSSAEPSGQMMWHHFKVEVLSLKHQPSHRYLDIRQECRSSKSVASHSCDWLFLI